MGVSYATPAFYADRLCERGRCYLCKQYNPTPAYRNQYDNYRDAQERAVEQARNRPPPARGQRKTAQDLKQDKADEAQILNLMKTWLRDDIRERWFQEPVQAVTKRKDWEDYEKAWYKTMYWM